MRKEIVYGILFSFFIFLAIWVINLSYNKLAVNFSPTEVNEDELVKEQEIGGGSGQYINQMQQPPPVPVPPALVSRCEVSNLTSLVMRQLPSGRNFVNFKPFDDETKRYFFLRTNTTPNLIETWVYDIGNDSVFSNDDGAYLPFANNQNSIKFMESTGGGNGQPEYLYWVDKSNSSYEVVKKCQLPQCTNQQIIVPYSTVRYGNIYLQSISKVLEHNSRLYILTNNITFNNSFITPGVSSVASCSLININNTDWCGNIPSNYIQHGIASHSYDSKSIRGEGIGLEVLVSQFTSSFFSLRTNRFIHFTGPGLFASSFVKQSPGYLFVADVSLSRYLLGLDNINGTFTNLGGIRTLNTTPLQIAIDPRGSLYPLIVYWDYRSLALYQKDSANNAEEFLLTVGFCDNLFIYNNKIYCSVATLTMPSQLMEYTCS